MLIEVIPGTKTFSEIKTFSYLVPENLIEKIKIGSIVTVPFGKQKILGVVSKIGGSETESKFKIKEIISVNEDFSVPENYLKVAEWISDYYLCSLGDAMALFLPPVMKRQRKNLPENTEQQVRETKLSEEQNHIFCEIRDEFLFNCKKKPILIHGVTGSGKTEIYISLTAEALKNNKGVIVLVPEIILTPQTVNRFQKVFGDQVALMHSNLSKSEKLKCYDDFYCNRKPILIGPRSALLVPNHNLGLIIIDEEHEDAYKQDQNPRYHARELAIEIGKECDALVVMGSATPSVESYYQAKKGQYQLYSLINRYGKNCLPEVTVVDLRDEIKKKNFSPISELLKSGIENTLKDKKQILLFLNRRGASTFVSCRDCGHVVNCKNCNIPMVYHLKESGNYLNCHHCDEKMAVPTLCPNCGGTRIKYFGAGVEKIELEIRKLFPEARVFRADATTIKTKNDYKTFYDKFIHHDVDIVIGTQIITKGLDIPNVDLVGVVSADTGMNFPQYKAMEKTFELLTQVAGRSGRKESVGKAIIQTYWPDAVPIKSAKDHNFIEFYENEIKERELHCYPPFCRIVRILVENINEKKAQETVSRIALNLNENSVNFIGPGKCFYSKLRNKYRYHLILKMSGNDWADKILKLKGDFPEAIIDVDSISLL